MSKITTGTLEPGIGEDNTIKVAGNAEVQGNQKVEGNFSVDGTMEQAALPMFACRAWVNFDGTDGSIRASGNVSSVVRNSTGDYTINFAVDMPDTNYAFWGNSVASTDQNYVLRGVVSKTVSALRLLMGGTSAVADLAQASVAVFR